MIHSGVAQPVLSGAEEKKLHHALKKAENVAKKLALSFLAG